MLNVVLHASGQHCEKKFAEHLQYSAQLEIRDYSVNFSGFFL
jgi:hypothetical protein